MAMVAWGDRWTAGDAGPPVLQRHRTCGQITQVELRCSACGETLHSTDVDVEPGPGLATAVDGAEEASGAALDVAGSACPPTLGLRLDVLVDAEEVVRVVGA